MPVSDRGVLLAIGGVITPMDLVIYAQSTDDPAVDEGFMTNIPVFDVATEAWTLQAYLY